MRRFALIAGVLLVLSTARSSQADNWFSDCWHDFWAATHRNNAWPEAFIPADRYSVRAPFATCVANGWRAQNTLVDYHFDDETGRLNEAGTLRVQSILIYTPPAYRTVFLVRGPTPENTAARLASVQEAASRIVPPGEMPPVIDTNVEPRSTPAYYIVDVDRSFRESTPDPRLPAGTRATSGGSGSSSSGS
jgi:hypothetical protein